MQSHISSKILKYHISKKNKKSKYSKKEMVDKISKKMFEQLSFQEKKENGPRLSFSNHKAVAMALAEQLHLSTPH